MDMMRRSYSYSRVEKEDPDERKHRRAQFLIYKTLDKAETRHQSPSLGRLMRSNSCTKTISRVRKAMMSVIRKA